MSLLVKAKKVLRAQAVELYQTYEGDIPLKKEDFIDHYSNLGELLFEIESIETVNELLNKLMKGDFNKIGYFEDNEDLIEEFLDMVNK